MSDNASVSFFDAQFRRQAAERDFGLNPFEARALPYLEGSILDLGCGLGNLALAAAAKGARVLALDASRSAIESLSERARALGLAISARCADLRDYAPEDGFDAVVAIGLFMFFPCDAARGQLRRSMAAIRPGGVVALNVLIEGTTYMGMFDPRAGYCLFGEDELPLALAGWQMLDDRIEQFDAPAGTLKRFRTCIARRPRP